MILKSNSQKKTPVYSDLRDLGQIDNLSKEEFQNSTYIHKLPELPTWTNKKYSSQGETQNLYHLTCSCSDYAHRAELFDDRDIRRICKHLYWKLTNTRASEHLDTLSMALLKDVVIYKEWNLYKTMFQEKKMIIGRTNYRKSGWLNVYYPFHGDNYIGLGYSFRQNRWRNGTQVPNSQQIIDHIRRLILYIFQ